jgi:hypothetical protein
MSLLTVSPHDTSTITSAPTSPASVAEVSTHRPPRSSALATLSMLLAVPAALAVATGVLAAAGAALGLLGALAGIGGLTATRYRHIAGRGNAILGLLLGVAALAVGAMAVTGNLAWLDPSVNQFSRLLTWVHAHASWVTPKL